MICIGAITFKESIPDSVFIDACNSAKSVKDLSRHFQVSAHTITRRIDNLGCRKPNGKNAKDIYGYTDEDFIAICKKSHSMQQAAQQMHIPFTSFKRRAEQLGCYITNQAGKNTEKERAPQYKVNENYFSIWSPQMAYWYGFIVADGGIVPNTKHRIRLRLSRQYEYMLERFKQDIAFTGPILKGTTKASSNSDKTYSYADLTINNKKFVNSLKEKGIVARKTYLDVKYIQYVPTQFRPYFLIGLFDGDGHIATKSGNISISGNKANLISVLEYFGFAANDLRIENRGNYVNISLRNKKDSFMFYQIYLTYSQNIHTLEYKKERIEYFYNIQSQRHPAWLSSLSF